ncbi:MAG: hypothetical protein ACYDCO_05440 [Armatimonadota bacterium]
MYGWEGWPVERFIYLFLGLAFLLVWGQVFLYHWRGAFRHHAMWAPVVLGPLLSLVALLFAWMHGGWMNWLLAVSYTAGTLVGIFGINYHLIGIKQRVGRWTLHNVMAGPPPVLPAMFLALSLVGLLVFFIWSVPPAP